MALTLITNPVGSGVVKLFAGFEPVEFEFKREDLAITGVESGAGGLRIDLTTDLTSYLSVGDSIYVYSEGTNYTYDAVGIILSLTATDITTDIPFVEAGTGGYINYLKNYYVEMQCVNKTFSTSLVIPFSLIGDGDSAGNVSIDVSIVNDLNDLRGEISDGFISDSAQEFEVQYREVYEGSSNSFTLIDNKLVVLLYAAETPTVDNEILNGFDLPKIYLGYPAAFVIAKEADPASSLMTMSYRELDPNQLEVADGELSELASDVNGFISWAWSADATIEEITKFIELSTGAEVGFDFASPDFAYPDFLTE